MKKNVFFLLISLFVILTSCHEMRNKELYNVTDKYVQNLSTTYQSYGLLGGDEQMTSNNEYHIMPIGRLINVRIEKVSTDEEYQELIEDLKSHYKGDSRVKNVYRCQAGTIMIDCRN